MRVGFIGVGRLGAPVCDRVVDGGHDVHVFDVAPELVAPRVAHGAVSAASAADAARDAEVVIVFVRDDAQALTALTGPAGALEAAPVGCVVVVHSTISPGTVRRLDAACRERGVRFIDVGVSAAIQTQPLSVYSMCGGDHDDVERARPVLESYSREIVRFGDVGAGMAAKLVRNFWQYAFWCTIHEGMALGEEAGLDLDALARLFRDTVPSTGEMVLQRPTMRPITVDDADRDKVTFLLDIAGLGWKDLEAAIHLGREVGADVPMHEVVRERYGPALGIVAEPPPLH